MKHTALRYGVLLFFGVAAFGVSTPGASAEGQPLELRQVLDLRRDGANVFVFSSASRELFVSHPGDYRNLYQWNIETGKLVHTYTCPGDDARWDSVAVSPDGTLLVASTYPRSLPSQLLFIDTQTQQVRFTAEYNTLVREIRFDRTGVFVWVETTYPGPDPFVYDCKGEKHSHFKREDFEPVDRERLWKVPNSKVGPPAGLFYRDVRGTVHKLFDHDPTNYALTADNAYVGASSIDRRLRIWRTSDLKEVFNEVIGAYPVFLAYDSKENQFLVLDGIDGNSYLRAIKLPK